MSGFVVRRCSSVSTPARVELHSGRFQPDAIHPDAAARRDQQCVIFQFPAIAQGEAFTLTIHPGGPDAEVEFHPFVEEPLGNQLGGFRHFARQQAVGATDQLNLAAEPAKTPGRVRS